MSAEYAPIALFVYNRPEHTRLTVEALQKNEGASSSSLFVFSDGPKTEAVHEKVQEVRKYVKEVRGFAKITIVERDKNLGLAANIIDGVGKLVSEFGRVIVLEDDLITSPVFLQFMNESLEKYAHEDRVASIQGYMYPIQGLPELFFLRGTDCWGWATWKRGWSTFNPDGRALLSELREKNLTWEFDFNGTYPYTKMLIEQIEGKNNSWAVRWYASAFLANGYALYPGKSLVKNIGLDGSGTHCESSDDFQVELGSTPVTRWPERVSENHEARLKIERFLASRQSRLRKCLNLVKRIFQWKK